MFRIRSASHALTGLLVAVATVAVGPPPAQAEPRPRPVPAREFGNGPERNEVAALLPAPALDLEATGESQETSPLLRDSGQRGYPRQNRLRVYPENPADKSIKLGLTPYHGIAPKLNELQARSNRVSAEVIGRSALGRELYLVTVTAPERPAETRQQHAWRTLIEDAPSRAARDRSLQAGYKAPIWINGNIHGNEWEGTDGSLRLIEELVSANDPATERLLRRTRMYFTVTNNPDGRIVGARVNGNGFDLNRDLATSSQPEARAMRGVAIGTQPLVMLDEHGYTGTTLIEPATAPHGQNYDYDLYIKHAYPNAIGMEKSIGVLGHPETARADIPFRDFAPGDWDDWPPIFTPMYAMYHGAVGHTVEVPLRVNGAAYDTLPVQELRRRSAINVDVVEATIRGAIGYTDAHRTGLIADQIELFRRGWAGEPQRVIPDGFVPGFGPEDRYSTAFPRAYVIPAGAGQRSAVAAARLVDHLVANDVRVRRAVAPFTLAGRRYAAGSYLVDLHQPKRGLANAILEAGQDISAKVPQMYDISGWSHRLLWGSSVDVVRAGSLPRSTVQVSGAARSGEVAARPGADLLLTLTDGRDARAVNALLEQGVAVRWRDNGTVVVPAAARPAAARLAARLDVRFTAATAGDRGTVLHRPVVAAAVSADELFALREMGFDVRPVSTAVLNAGFDLSDVDTLFVSSGLTYSELNPTARAALDGYLARGGVVTRGTTGARFNAEARLLPVTAQAGRGDANGVVSVLNGAGPVAAGSPPQSFVFSPLWFTEIGRGVTVEQRYGAAKPLVAGHWLATAEGVGGPEQAAGRAAVVSGVAERGTATVLFGTEPLFRAHPKGLYAQVARGILWSTTR